MPVQIYKKIYVLALLQPSAYLVVEVESFRMQYLVRFSPLPIYVYASQIATEIAIDYTVWVHHWQNLKNIALT
jgi:hypothetical protein